MSVLTLRLAGPLQSWGSASRYTRRTTESAPTKSGILGLLAAAQGRRRSDPIEDLLDLELAVRTDQPGTLLRDFHTAHHQVSGSAMPLTERFYVNDAVFTAYVGGTRPVLEGLAEALRDPVYPLYFGRRACVPEGRMVLGVEDIDVEEAVGSCPWQAGRVARRQWRDSESVRLTVQADQTVYPDLPAYREVNDVPLSFDPERRLYRSRAVVECQVVVPTGNAPRAQHISGLQGGHDPFEALGGQS